MENDIQKQLQEIIANAVTHTMKRPSTSSMDGDTAKYATQFLSIPEGKKLDKWVMLKIQIATLCLTFSQLGIHQVAHMLRSLLEDMERYESLELEGMFRK
jgi:hypothetical protein